MIDPDGRAPLDWYRNNTTGKIAWKDGSSKVSGYTNLGFNYSNQSAGATRTDHLVMDGGSKTISVNGNTVADFSKGSSGSLIKSGFTIWGDDRSGSTDGLKGITTDSFNSSDIPTLSNGNGQASSIFSKVDSILDQIAKFFEIADTAGDTMDRVGGVVEQVKNAKKEPKEEPKAKDSVTVFTYENGKLINEERKAVKDVK